jgi:hypothetical protein
MDGAQQLEGLLGSDSQAAHPSVDVDVDSGEDARLAPLELELVGAIDRVESDLHTVSKERGHLTIYDSAEDQDWVPDPGEAKLEGFG